MLKTLVEEAGQCCPRLITALRTESAHVEGIWKQLRQDGDARGVDGR